MKRLCFAGGKVRNKKSKKIAFVKILGLYSTSRVRPAEVLYVHLSLGGVQGGAMAGPFSEPPPPPKPP